MKRNVRIVSLALLLALVLSLGTAAASADASTIQGDDKWNIMLVIDGSGSLDHTQYTPTDPLGLRYYAVANFLGTLNDDSANVGAIVFTANYAGDTSDEAMRNGIKCNTGLLPLSDLGTKDYIMDQVDPKTAYCVQDEIRYGKAAVQRQTDIGTALLEAYNTLKAAEEPGRKSAIFLFTDGETEVRGDILAQSQANRQTATSGMLADGMVLCGIYLNGGSTLGDDSEVRSIVAEANGLAPSDLRINDLYVEIHDARDCIDATDAFLRALGYAIDEESEIITSTTERNFLVPGVGVLDATIRLYTVDGTPLPQGLDVSFRKPNGDVIGGAAANALCFSWSSTSPDTKLRDPISRVYKLKMPEPGLWTVHVDVPEGNTVEIHYSPSFNVDIGAVLVSDPVAGDVHANMDVLVTAQLTQFGQVLTDARNYDFYACALHMKDIDTGVELPPIDIPNNNGVFQATVSTADNFHDYYVWVEFTCEQVAAASERAEWRMKNSPPTVTGNAMMSVKYGLFQPKEAEFDLKNYADDLEDGKNLSFTVVGANDCDVNAVSQDVPGSSLLRIRTDKIGEGELLLRVTDSQGAGADMKLIVRTKNMTLLMVLLMLAAAVVLAVIAVIVIRLINRPVVGKCQLSFNVGDERYELQPAVPGSGAYGRHTDMLTIATYVTRNGADGIDSDKLPAVQAFINEHASALKAIKVGTCWGKVKDTFSGGSREVGMLRVRGKGLDKKLYRGTVRLVDDLFEFSFYPPEESNDDEEDGGYYSEEDSSNSYAEEASYGSFGDSYGAPSDSYGADSYGTDSYGSPADTGSSSGSYSYDDD